MNIRQRNTLRAVVLIAVIAGLVFAFPGTIRFVEMAARELRYLWWLILIVALAGWLIWGFRGKPKR